MSATDNINDIIAELEGFEAEYKAACEEFDLPENIAEHILTDSRIPSEVRSDFQAALTSEAEATRAAHFAAARSTKKRRHARQMI